MADGCGLRRALGLTGQPSGRLDMKIAVVNGERREAQPGLAGICPACDRPMMAKCGEVKVWHWAHHGRRVCDPWWENETEWHRAWKNEFPVDWQEIVHTAGNGEKHIADVKTDHGWVIEFQHSHLHPEERRSRNAFYKKLAWVVDATRRKTDAGQFGKALMGGVRLGRAFKVQPDGCSLLREWGDTSAPVFFDFGDGPSLWWLLAKGAGGHVYVAPFSRADFVNIHRDGSTKITTDFQALVDDVAKLVASYESPPPETSRQAGVRTTQTPRRTLVRTRRRF